MYSERAAELLKGAYDLHVHAGPGFFPRKLDAAEYAAELAAAGMGGAVVKEHQGSTVAHAYFAEKAVEGKAKIYGSIVLNTFVGGINPAAAEAAVRLGAKIVYMPTISAANHIEKMGAGFQNMPGGSLPAIPKVPIRILREDGSLLPEVYEIFDVVKEGNVLLATGHLSNREAILLCREARKYGVEKLVFTHPDYMTSLLPFEAREELVRLGVFMELTYLSFDAAEAPDRIRRLGAERHLATTDYGQVFNVSPVAGMGQMVDDLLRSGISEREIRTMIRDNAKYILDV